MTICHCGRTALKNSDKCLTCARKSRYAKVRAYDIEVPKPSLMTTLVEWFCKLNRPHKAKTPVKASSERPDATERTRLLRRHGDPTAASDLYGVLPVRKSTMPKKIPAAKFISLFTCPTTKHERTALDVIRQSHSHEMRTKKDWGELLKGYIELSKNADMWPSERRPF